MYDSKFFNKLLEIKFDPSIKLISAIQLDNNDLIFAIDSYFEDDYKILIYRLKEKQYFEYQKIIEDRIGFKDRYEFYHRGCVVIQYKMEYEIDNLKKISGKRFICISNYGLKIYSLNENNEYSLVLLNDHSNDIKIIHEINNNKFIFCTKNHNDILIEMVELKEITKKELDDKLNEKKCVENLTYCGTYQNIDNIYQDKLKKLIELLKFSCSFKIINFEEYKNDSHLSSYILIKRKYFIVLINNNIFIIDIINGKLLKRYEIYLI